MTNITMTAANDFVGYLEAYAASFQSGYYGYFGSSPTDFSGNQFAQSESSAVTPAGVADDAWSVVMDSGSAGDLSYDFSSHVLGGALDGVSFGAGLDYNATTDSFSQVETDIQISGLGLTGSGSGNDVHNVVYGMMQNDPTALLQEIADDDLVVTGSSGADGLYSFGGDDVLTGNAGADSFVFDLDALSTFGITLSSLGTDTVTDFDAGEDTLVFGLNDTAYDSYAELIALATDSSAGVVFDLDSYGSLTLAGVTVGDLSADNFDFV